MSKATYYVQECPTCGRRLRVRVVYLGKSIACQHCSAEFVAQDPQSGAPAPSESSLGLLRRAEELLAIIDTQHAGAPSQPETAWQPLPR